MPQFHIISPTVNNHHNMQLQKTVCVYKTSQGVQARGWSCRQSPNSIQWYRVQGISGTSLKCHQTSRWPQWWWHYTQQTWAYKNIARQTNDVVMMTQRDSLTETLDTTMTIIVLFVIQRLIKLFNHKVKLLAFVIVTKKHSMGLTRCRYIKSCACYTYMNV